MVADRLDLIGRHVLAALRHWLQRYGDRFHWHGLHPCRRLRSLLRSLLAPDYNQTREQSNTKNKNASQNKTSYWIPRPLSGRWMNEIHVTTRA